MEGPMDIQIVSQLLIRIQRSPPLRLHRVRFKGSQMGGSRCGQLACSALRVQSGALQPGWVLLF